MFKISIMRSALRLAVAGALVLAVSGWLVAEVDEAAAASTPDVLSKFLKSSRKTAEYGLAVSQYMLGSIYGGIYPDYSYNYGEGVRQDFVKAYMWLSLAAAQGNEFGRQNRDAAAELMTPVEVLKAEALARAWLKKHQE